MDSPSKRLDGMRETIKENIGHAKSHLGLLTLFLLEPNVETMKDCCRPSNS